MRTKLPADEIPTADAVAAALVAAAKVLGEDPMKIVDPNALNRCRWPALAALQVFYPRMPFYRLGALVNAAASAKGRLDQARGMRWWKPTGETAFHAAITALETL